MEITELFTFTESEFRDLAYLMQVLDPECELTPRQLQQTVSHPSSRLFVMLDSGRIIGCYTLGIFFSPTGKKVSLEDVVVHPDYQGQHLGRQLVEHALEQLRHMAPVHVQLTSRPSRVAANALYRKLGFQQKETNAYIMNIEQH